MTNDENLRSSKYWRDRAEKARTMGAEMQNGTAKETMMDIAAKYEIMARLAAEREARRPKRS